MSFHSYFWNGTKLYKGIEEIALNKLLHSKVSGNERIDALETLLMSNSTPAQCIAIDHYCCIESYKRWGRDNYLKSMENLVRERIDGQLNALPYHRTELSAHPRIGANHASAFHAAWILEYNCGAERLISALKNNTDPEVILEGIRAVDSVIIDDGKSYPSLMALLIVYAKNKELPVEIRKNAIKRIGNIETDEYESFLIEITKDSQFEVVAVAARCLGERDIRRYRTHLQRVIESWPDEFICYEASEVRDMLEDTDR